MSFPSSPTRNQEDGLDGVEEYYQEQNIDLPVEGVEAAESIERAQPWYQLKYVTTEIPTDLSVQVEGTTFTVHKHIMVSKCGSIRHLNIPPSSSNIEHQLKLDRFPGGADTFKLVLKHCYGLPLNFGPNNIAQLRCASEFLEMTEEIEDGNLITKTESFFTFIILSSWNDTITVLRSCEKLSPWAENLQIVRRCCDTIAIKAFRNQVATSETSMPEGWWCEDMTTLRIEHFSRIVTAMNAKGVRQRNIVDCIIQYARRWLSGMDYEFSENELQYKKIDNKEKAEEQKIIIENLVNLLPVQEALPCEFLSKMLKVALAYSASPALTSELEKRIGMTLDTATVRDLLIPNCRNHNQGTLQPPANDTIHDMDIVQRIIEYYLMRGQEQEQLQAEGKFEVSKVLDNYLITVAEDPNLSIIKFQALAEALPENQRNCHDGLYKAVDTYIKSHLSLSEHDRRRLCKVINCAKLSLDASTHAAQNERLPVRTAIQVLFTQQVKMMKTMRKQKPTLSSASSDHEGNDTTLRAQVVALRTELEIVQNRMTDMQRDYSLLLQHHASHGTREKNIPKWAFSWKKLGTTAIFHKKQCDDTTEEAGEGIYPPRHGRHSRRRQSLS